MSLCPCWEYIIEAQYFHPGSLSRENSSPNLSRYPVGHILTQNIQQISYGPTRIILTTPHYIYYPMWDFSNTTYTFTLTISPSCVSLVLNPLSSSSLVHFSKQNHEGYHQDWVTMPDSILEIFAQQLNRLGMNQSTIGSDMLTALHHTNYLMWDFPDTIHMYILTNSLSCVSSMC